MRKWLSSFSAWQRRSRRNGCWRRRCLLPPCLHLAHHWLGGWGGGGRWMCGWAPYNVRTFWAGLQVKHLEVSSASMAEDLCRKSAIIETYVMDSRIGQCLLPGLPPIQSLTCRLLPHCLLSSHDSAKVLTRSQLLEGRAGPTALPFCLSLCHRFTLLSPVWFSVPSPSLLSSPHLFCLL